MQLIPEFQSLAGSSKTIFVFPLAGFAGIHLAEKHLAKEGLEHEKVREEFKELHSGFLFLYHGSIGFLLTSIFTETFLSGLLFYMPILLHTTVSSLSFSELHEEATQRLPIKILISISPIIGSLFYFSQILTSQMFGILFGIVSGMFMYVVIRDSIPRGRLGKPFSFAIGMTLYIVLICLTKIGFA